jgi:hypothetical protein
MPITLHVYRFHLVPKVHGNSVRNHHYNTFGTVVWCVKNRPSKYVLFRRVFPFEGLRVPNVCRQYDLMPGKLLFILITNLTSQACLQTKAVQWKQLAYFSFYLNSLEPMSIYIKSA